MRGDCPLRTDDGAIGWWGKLLTADPSSGPALNHGSMFRHDLIPAMAHITDQSTFSGSGNRGVQLGQNLGHFESHHHYPPGTSPDRPGSRYAVVLTAYLERPETPPNPSLLISFERDTDFVDRGTVLAQIRERCGVPGSRTALVGLGGVGYARRTHMVRRRLSSSQEVATRHRIRVSNAQTVAGDMGVLGAREQRGAFRA
jgi:hypothetical protein